MLWLHTLLAYALTTAQIAEILENPATRRAEIPQAITEGLRYDFAKPYFSETLARLFRNKDCPNKYRVLEALVELNKQGYIHLRTIETLTDNYSDMDPLLFEFLIDVTKKDPKKYRETLILMNKNKERYGGSRMHEITAPLTQLISDDAARAQNNASSISSQTLQRCIDFMPKISPP